MPTTDIVNVPSDSISSISTSAWNLMPADTINSLTTGQISVLSIDQLTTLANSPSYSSFSNSIISNVENQITQPYLTVVSDAATPTPATGKTAAAKTGTNNAIKKESKLVNYLSFIIIFIILDFNY